MNQEIIFDKLIENLNTLNVPSEYFSLIKLDIEAKISLLRKVGETTMSQESENVKKEYKYWFKYINLYINSCGNYERNIEEYITYFSGSKKFDYVFDSKCYCRLRNCNLYYKTFGNTCVEDLLKFIETKYNSDKNLFVQDIKNVFEFYVENLKFVCKFSIFLEFLYVRGFCGNESCELLQNNFLLFEKLKLELKTDDRYEMYKKIKEMSINLDKHDYPLEMLEQLIYFR
jgi:hypothetical protein